MRLLFYIIMFILGACIALNIYFLFHIGLYRSVYGSILIICTSLPALTYLIVIGIRKRKLKKAIDAEYENLFHKN